MQVSATTPQCNYGYIFSASTPSYEANFDTSFNSLTPFFTTKKTSGQEDLKQVYDNINEWKNFCHKQILGSKLNVIA